MVKKFYLTLLAFGILSAVSFAAIQPSMNFRSNWANKTAMTLMALPDNTNNWVISFPQTTIGAGSNQWFKMEVTGSYTTNQTWGYGSAPVFNTSTTIPVNGANGLMTAVSGKTYVFSIKDVASSTASVGFVFELGGTPVTISTATASAAVPGSPVTVTATLSGALPTNQTVWLRYAIGSSTYSGSVITQMTGSGTSYTATIPGQTIGITVYYYCFSSGTVAGGGGVTTTNVTQATINKTASANYTVMTTEVLTANPSSLNSFSYFPGSGPSASQSYSLSGTDLSGYPGNITVTAPTDYEISLDNGTNWSSSRQVPFTSATLNATTVYVRLKAGLAQGNYNESVTNVGGGTSRDVPCTGTVLKYAPSNQATGFTASNGSPSATAIHFVWTDDGSGSPAPDGYLIRGSAAGYGSIAAPTNGTAVPDGGLDKNVAQGVQVADITGLSQGTTYYFTIYSYTNSGANILYNLVGSPQTSATTTVSTYYSKATGNLDDLSSWGANQDGTGNAPLGFTSDGLTFVIKNNPAPAIGGTWAVSGATTKIQVGDGTTAVNFSVPFTLTATNLDIMSSATVTLGSNVTLTGTINVKNGGTLNCNSYIVSGTGGIFNLNSGGTLKIGSATGITSGSTASGNIQTTGSRTYNAAGKYVYNGTVAQVTGNGLPQLASGGVMQISNTASTVTASQYIDVVSGAIWLVDAGATFTTSAQTHHFEPGCLVTINGTFQIDASGGTYSSGANACFTYGPNATLAVNGSSQIALYSNNSAWNNNTGYVASPPNVNIKGAGGVSLQTYCAMSVSGTFQTSGPVAIGGGSLTFNGMCKINAGGSFTNSPTFGAASTLIYNQGSSKTRGNEWTANTSGTGYPNNVVLSNNSTISMGTTAAQCAGSLTIDAGSTLNTTSNTLSVLGNVSINGTISLAGDMKTKGNWTKIGNFYSNSRMVSFNGSTPQLISGAVNFAWLEISNAGGVTLQGAVTDTVFNNLMLTAGKLTIDSSNVVLVGSISGTPGSANMVVTKGPGEFRKVISSVPTSFTFPVGSDNIYSPAHITLTDGTLASAYIGIKVAPTKSANNTSSTAYLNRTWTITANGITSPVYSDTLVYAATDAVGSEAALIGGLYSGSSWINLGAVDADQHFVKGNGLTAFGDFSAGEAGMFSNVISVAISAIPEGYYDQIAGTLRIRDTLHVYIADATAPYANVDSSNLIIDPASFTGTATFTHAENGSYYIYIAGRAIIQTWSAAPIPLASGTTAGYDFTTASSKAYGNKMIQKGGKWCIYSGDVDQTGYIDNNDLLLIDNDAFNFVGRYAVTDLDGSLYVDNNDLLICDNNAYNFIGTSTPRVAITGPAKPAIKQVTRTGD